MHAWLWNSYLNTSELTVSGILPAVTETIVFLIP
jgi:hypothetical protein